MCVFVTYVFFFCIPIFPFCTKPLCVPIFSEHNAMIRKSVRIACGEYARWNYAVISWKMFAFFMLRNIIQHILDNKLLWQGILLCSWIFATYPNDSAKESGGEWLPIHTWKEYYLCQTKCVDWSYQSSVSHALREMCDNKFARRLHSRVYERAKKNIHTLVDRTNQPQYTSTAYTCIHEV